MRRKPAAHSVPARTPLTSDTMLLISKPNLVYRRCKSASIAATSSYGKSLVTTIQLSEHLFSDLANCRLLKGEKIPRCIRYCEGALAFCLPMQSSILITINLDVQLICSIHGL